MATLAEVTVRIGADISALQKGLRDGERELSRTGSRMSSLGNNLSVAFTLPLAAAGVAAFKFGTELESTFLKIDNLTEISDANLAKLRTTISGISAPLGKTQAELSAAAYFIEGAGLQGAEGLTALEQSAKASSIGLGEQTDVAKIAGAAVAAYGSDVLSASQSIDQLLQIAREGNAEPKELAASLGTVLPIASQLGVSFAEVGANVASFTRLGVGASTAADGLKSALGNILKPSEQAVEELRKVGLTADDVRKSIRENGLAETLRQLLTAFDGNIEGVSRVFGDVQGLTAVLATAGAQGEAYAASLGKIENAAGAVDAAFEKVSESADFKLKQSLVELNNTAVEFGAVIVPVVSNLIDLVLPLVRGFGDMSDGAKTFAASGLLVVAAFGPLTSAVGSTLSVFSAVRSSVGSFTGGIRIAATAFTDFQAVSAAGAVKFTTMQNALRATTFAWKAFDTATKATIIGIAAVAVIGLVTAVARLASEADAAAQSQQRVADAVASANVEIGKEKIIANNLFGTLLDLSKSTDQRAAALKALQEKYPSYLEGMSIEKTSLDQIREAQKGVNEELVKSAALKARAAAQDETAAAIAQKLQRITQLRGGAPQTVDEASKVNVGEVIKYGSIAGGVIAELQKEVVQLTAEMSKLDDEFEKTFNVRRSGDSVVTADQLDRYYNPEKFAKAPVKVVGGKLKGTAESDSQIASKKRVDEQRDAVKNLRDELAVAEKQSLLFGASFDVNAEKVEILRKGIKDLLEAGLSPKDPAVLEFSKMFDNLQTSVSLATPELQVFSTEVDLATKRQNELLTATSAMAVSFYDWRDAALEVNKTLETAKELGLAVGSAISQASDSAGSSLESMGKAALAAARDFVAAKIAEGVAAQVAAALGAGPLGLFLAPVAGAAAAGIFKALLSNIAAPFATGDSKITGPTFAMLGEYPGASTNPEYVFRGDQIRKVFREETGGNAPGGEFVVRGTDLVLVLDRAQAKRKTTRGY